MATTLQHLARWALQLQKDQIPSDVLDLAKMQHLAVAGAVRGLGDSALASQLLAAGPRRPPRGPPISSGAPQFIGGHTSSDAHALRADERSHAPPRGAEPALGGEMSSTGEVACCGRDK